MQGGRGGSAGKGYVLNRIYYNGMAEEKVAIQEREEM